jgi:2'-5' RNA ligase
MLAKITVQCCCEVEASTEEEAIERASALKPALHFDGSGTYPDENWLIADVGGQPENIHIDKFADGR